MTADDVSRELGSDQLAFYFDCEGGIDADVLGKFLQRAATVARGKDANLQVLVARDGSLAIIVRVLKRSRSAVGKEFGAAPIQTSAAATVIVASVAAAISYAMNPDSGMTTPLAKAGAELVEERGIKSIELVTKDSTILIMDRDRAINILHRSTSTRIESVPSLMRDLSLVEADLMAVRAFEGMLIGTVLVVDSELHFRPEGYRYLIPMNFPSNYDGRDLVSGKAYRIRGHIKFRGLAPDLIVINSASQI